MLSMAIRLMGLFSTVAAGQGINMMVTAAEAVLVCLITPQELEAPDSAPYGVFNTHGYGNNPGAHLRAAVVVSSIVKV
jgi:hypothetical protein